MFNQSCHCQNGCQNNKTCSCQMNTPNWETTQMNINPCVQPLVAPRRVCVSHQVTPVAQPVICPIECRRVNRYMYYPVFYPRYEQTFVNEPFNQSF